MLILTLFFSYFFRYYLNSNGVILVYDICSRESFNELDIWLNDIKVYSNNPIIVLVGNKSDKNARVVTRDEGAAFAQDNNINHFFEVSALNGTNISEIFSTLLSGMQQQKNKSQKHY